MPLNCEISNAFALALIKHNGKGIYFVEETSCGGESEGPILSNQTADILSKYKGNLSFDFLPSLNYGNLGDEITIAKALAKHKGGELGLECLTELSKEAARELCKHERPVWINESGLTSADAVQIYKEAEKRWEKP